MQQSSRVTQIASFSGHTFPRLAYLAGCYCGLVLFLFIRLISHEDKLHVDSEIWSNRFPFIARSRMDLNSFFLFLLEATWLKRAKKQHTLVADENVSEISPHTFRSECLEPWSRSERSVAVTVFLHFSFSLAWTNRWVTVLWSCIIATKVVQDNDRS